MKKLVGCALLPHPPIMIPEIGGHELNKIQATVTAAEQVARMIEDRSPETVIIMTSHGPVFRDAVSISLYPRMRGSFAAFGQPDIALGFETDGLLVRHILRKAERLGINYMEVTDDVAKMHRLPLGLDHGALVPLYYLHKAGFKGQIVHLSMGFVSYEEMYTFGKAVQGAIGIADRRTAVIASGDLSHRLLPDSSAGYSPQGAEFDRQVVAALENVNVKALLAMDPQMITEAGECGLRPIIFLLGVLGGLDAKANVLSYEGPFGVGYCVAMFQPANEIPECNCK